MTPKQLAMILAWWLLLLGPIVSVHAKDKPVLGCSKYTEVSGKPVVHDYCCPRLEDFKKMTEAELDVFCCKEELLKYFVSVRGIKNVITDCKNLNPIITTTPTGPSNSTQPSSTTAKPPTSTPTGAPPPGPTSTSPSIPGPTTPAPDEVVGELSTLDVALYSLGAAAVFIILIVIIWSCIILRKPTNSNSNTGEILNKLDEIHSKIQGSGRDHHPQAMHQVSNNICVTNCSPQYDARKEPIATTNTLKMTTSSKTHYSAPSEYAFLAPSDGSVPPSMDVRSGSRRNSEYPQSTPYGSIKTPRSPLDGSNSQKKSPIKPHTTTKKKKKKRQGPNSPLGRALVTLSKGSK